MRMNLLAGFLIVATSSLSGAAEVTVNFPWNTAARSAVATAADSKVESAGKIDGEHVTFANLRAKTEYDLRISLADGTVLQGVNMEWYRLEPPVKNAGELTDDEREEIRAIVQDVRGFFNRSEILLIRGDHDRATLLVQLIRDKAFHADKGGEIVWHIELWYFKFQHGGWEKVPQQNRVLRRERFNSREAFDAEAGKIRWIEALGGVRLTTDDEKKQINLPANALSGQKTNTPERRP